MSQVTIRMLGACHASIDGRPVAGVPTAFYRLGAYLALAGPTMSVSRARLASLLWPEATHDKANANLRQGIARIKAFQDAHGFRLFQWNQDVITFATDPNLNCDIRRFIENHGRREPRIPALLCTLYSGDLLADIPDSGTEFEEWLRQQRLRVREMFVDRIAEALAPGGIIAENDRVACARQLLVVDPCNEQGYRTLMADAASRGDVVRVATLYRRCVDTLQTELGVRPSRMTRELATRLTDADGDAVPSNPPAHP